MFSFEVYLDSRLTFCLLVSSFLCPFKEILDLFPFPRDSVFGFALFSDYISWCIFESF